MESILVTPEELRIAAGDVDENAGTYYREYTALLGDVRELTSLAFTGEAGQAFLQKVENFEPEFAKMKQLMEEYAAFLRQAATNYDNTQENIIRDIAGRR